MRLLSGRMCDDEVDLTLQAWGQDLDGSRVVASTRMIRSVPCAALPGKPERRSEGKPEEALLRVTLVVPYTFEFDEDVGLNVDDLVAWADDSGAVHTTVVTGYGSPAGRPGTYVANAEERA